MPAFPFTAVRIPEPDHRYLGCASRLPLTRHRHGPGCRRDAVRIRRQLTAPSGLVGHSLLEPARMGAGALLTVPVAGHGLPRAVAGREGPLGVTDRRYHHGNLAAAAVAAAEQEIAAHGIAEASLRKVADRAGVSHTAVGKRFGDKAGLLAAVAAEGYRALGEALAAAAGDMRAMGRAYVDFAVRRPALFAVMFQPTVYRADDPGVVAARGATTAMLRSGVGQATDDPTSDAAFGAWAFVHGIAALVLGGAIDGDAGELYERAASALFPRWPAGRVTFPV